VAPVGGECNKGLLLTLPSNRTRALLPLVAILGIVAVFVELNYTAYRGFFQDDELANLSLAPLLGTKTFIVGLLDPRFPSDNFRPVGLWYFAFMGSHFGLHFPPYMAPILGFHLANAALLYLLMRGLAAKQWCAIAGVAFFTLSASAFDAYWKPMYVFDLLCTTFSLASILFYTRRKWVLSFIAFWLACKAKELAVMLPAVLALYEYWFGARKFKVLLPFFVVSLSFGIQGVLLNPNKHNDYTFRFGVHSLPITLPFYAQRFFLFPGGGILLLALAVLRDRRIWFALSAMLLVMVPLLFLPGRVFEAYVYLPLAFAAIAIAATASRANPIWAWILLAARMPLNIRQLRHERRITLDRDRQIAAFVRDLGEFVSTNPDVKTLVYEAVPLGFHDWGVTAAWRILHHELDLPALWFQWPVAHRAMDSQTVACARWDPAAEQLKVRILTHATD
jgi:hypothetical protein